MVRTVVTGIAGRMGGTLVRQVHDAEGFELVGATERPGAPFIGLDAGLACGLEMLDVPVLDSLDKALARVPAQVVIDFSSPQAALENVRACAAHGVPLVVGTTGLTEADQASLARAAQHIPLLWAPNMSLGINLMLKLVHEAARILGPAFDVEIVELHHRHKKDAPSGTALRLGEVAAGALGLDAARDLRLSRAGNVGERPQHEIGIQALRGGDCVGEHTVLFVGEGERLEITHRAFHRDQFAQGALRAARFVVGKPAGLYDMTQVLDAASDRPLSPEDHL